MARAGFTAIGAGTIRFGKDGRWYCDDEPIVNQAICRLYSRTLIVEPDGSARLQLGEDRARVVIEDTPWVVTHVDGDPQGGFTVHLNDGSEEPLDVAGLQVSAENVLYCRVRDGRHAARLLRPAHYELLRHLEQAPDGAFVLRVGERRHPIASRGG